MLFLSAISCQDVLAQAGPVLTGGFMLQTLFCQTDYYAAPEFAKPPAMRGLETNDGLTPSTPFLITNFWHVAEAGDTLLLLDGRYTDPNSMINASWSVSVNGTAGSPITIRALNDGAVIIDGEGLYHPVDIRGSVQKPKCYYLIEGINACNSNSNVICFHCCEDCILRRVCAWNANPYKNAHVYTLSQTLRCLCEDCAAWGLGRKQAIIYGGSPGQKEKLGRDNILRRFWCRWEGTRCQDYHSENISFQYGASDSLLENVICTHDAWESLEYPPYWSFYSYFLSDGQQDYIKNTRLFGCIGYALKNSCLRTQFIFNVGGADVVDTTLRDCLAYVEPGCETCEPDHKIKGFAIHGRHYESIEAQHLTVVGGAGIKASAWDTSVAPTGPVIQNILAMKTLDPEDAYQAAILGHGYVDTVHFFNNMENFESSNYCTYVPTNILSTPSCKRDCDAWPVIDDTCRTALGIDPQLNIAGRNLLRPHSSPALRGVAPDGSDVGARIWFRYVDGILKDGKTGGQVEYLWPWPMEERIWRATVQYHLLNPKDHPRPVNVTKEVLTLDDGALPGDFNGDGHIDAVDRRAFDLCYTGPNVSVTDPNCYAFDFDEDDDVDDTDRAVFERWFGYQRPDFSSYRLLYITATLPEVPISASPIDLYGVGDGVASFTHVHTPNNSVTLTAPSSVEGYIFDHWNVDNHPLQERQQTITVVLTDDRTAKAVYLDDCNHNGITDLRDIANGASQDCNTNGIPDECEIWDDLNEDGNIDFMDFCLFAASWLESDCGTCDITDLTNDGRVDFDDLKEFTKHWLADSYN